MSELKRLHESSERLI